MMTILEDGLGANCCNRLIDGAITEADYLCCFNTYATKFEKAKRQLIAMRNDVQNDIVQEARQHNKTQVLYEVQLWMEEADAAINEGTITRKKCFYGMCSNCILQYQVGKKLEKKTLNIKGLLERNFTKVARASKNPGIKFYAPPNFIDFESRRPIFKDLVAVLGNRNYCMIGLQGLMGTGKTTLALQVGLRVEQSDSFQEVIFANVSDSPDINKIRRNIAWQLDFQLEEEEEQHSMALWARIANNEGKVLIILDDIREKLELKDIGIPHNLRHCCVLITTRNSKVCKEMECQQTFSLNPLDDGDGFDLFIEHVDKTRENSTEQFRNLAQEIVKNVCGGLPHAIAVIANMLKNYDQGEWEMILRPLLNSEPLGSDYQDWMKLRRSLKSTYDQLENEAKGLLLLCSLFPKDYEVPIEFLSKLGIGSGLFGEANYYCGLRDKLIIVKNNLIKSFLLLETKEACVRIHDLVREVVLSTEDEDAQVIMNSSGELKSSLKYLSWSNNGFFNHFDGTKLEVLLLWIKGEVEVEDLYAIFKTMVNLRVLFLCCDDKNVVYPTLSLYPFRSLKNIRTLILNGWTLDNIDILEGLNKLVSLEFENCWIMELPEEIVEVENLRFLGIRRCIIQRKNPFKVIGRCLQLEVLYFVKNVLLGFVEEDNGNAHPALQMYSVACSSLKYFVEDDNGLFKCFNTKHVKNLVSEEMFEYLVRRAEILELWEMGEAGPSSLIPGIVPMQAGAMEGLTKLCLYRCSGFVYIVDTGELRYVDVLSNLVELHLVDVKNVTDLYKGHMPFNTLRKLKIFKLLRCKNLRNIFLDVRLELTHLKVLQLDDCPNFTGSIFQISVARSLKLLEELSIKDCKKVHTLIQYECPRPDADRQNSDRFFFPRLKSLKIQGCDKLELVLSFALAGDLGLLEDLSIRSCDKLECIFGVYGVKGQVLHEKSMLPSLEKMELETVPSFINICKACNKCMQRVYPTPKDAFGQKKKKTPKDASTCAHGCCCLPTSSSESMESNETSHDQHPLRQSLSLRNIRQMTLTGCSKLCCLPIATDVMLVELKIQGCHKLKHIISNEPEDHDDVNGSSIFPELKMLEIKDCDDLKFLFPPTFSTGLQRLTSIDIDGAPKLENIFGGYHHEKNEVPIKLLALEKLSLRDVPQIVSMCAKNYHLEWPSLKHINLERELVKRAFPHSMVCLQGRQLKLETRDQDSIRRPCPDLMDCLRGRQPNCETGEDTMKLLMGMQHLTNLEIRDSEIEEIFNVEGIEIAGKVEIKLKVMKIEGLHKLSCLYKDPNNILNLSNLEDLVLSGCDQLTAIFTTSKMKHLPQLYRLEVTQCKELVYVIEDNGDSGQQSLPKLQTIRISNCEKLESLLSISTFSKLQKLESLEIEEASNLKEVFGCRQDDTRERRLKDVVPELLHLKLKNLPNLENFCRVIDRQSVKRIMKFEVFDCARWERLQGIEEPQSTYSNTGQAVPHISDVGTSSQGHSRSDIQKHMNTEEVTGEVPFSETSAMVPSSSDSASTGGLSTEETMENQANSPTPAVEEQASETSPAELEMTRTSLHSNGAIQNKRVQEGLTSKDDEEATPLADRAPRNSLATSVTPQQIVIERIPEDTAIMKGKAIPSSINSQAGNPQSSQPTLSAQEARKKIVGNNRRKQKMEIQWPTSALPSLAENNEEVTQKTGEEVPISRTSAKSNDAIRNERVQEGLTSKDDGEPTPLADIALRNSVTPRQDLIKIEPRNETIMTLQQEMGEMRNTVTESSMKRKVDHSSVYSEVGGSQSSQSMLTTKKTRHSSVQEGATETNLPHVVPSYYQESHIGVAGPSSQRLGIGEILEVMELKDGEPALLVKALELYPQLRLSRDEQRNRKIIALSYRVLCDILFMLTTKTPCTIATSEKLTLSENLDAAISLGFDKEWIDSVRAKVFGNAMFDVLAAEEETLVNKARLETYSTALEQVHDQRIEAIERVAMARRHLDLMRSELEAMDSQLFSELEERNKLIMNMMQFREIISASDRPFGI